MQQYHIKRLGHLGDGITEDGLFAPMTLPGETITAEGTGPHLENVKIVDPSDTRVKPKCRHFKACGGCQLQHASDDFVADFKVGIIRKALSAHGIETEIRPCLTSPEKSRRRASFAIKRTKKGTMSGFHARASDVIIEIPDCTLLDPELLAARNVAEQVAVLGMSRKGEVTATVTLSEAGLDIVVKGGKPLEPALELSLAQACDHLGIARLTWEDEIIATRHAPVQIFGTARVVPPPGSFLQATKDGETQMAALVCDITKGAKNVLDLFSGCGTFSLPLAQQANIHAVEGDAAMVSALDKGWRFTENLHHVSSETRDLFRRPLMPDELRKFDAIVIDPPRAGAEAQIAEIAKSQVPRIAYVSCNPVTFARDAATLAKNGFTLEFVQPIDQFRWSTHTELVASFSKIT